MPRSVDAGAGAGVGRGIDRDIELVGRGVGPVAPETTLRFPRGLPAGDEADVTCVFEWGDGKTFRVRQEIRKADGTLAAEVTAVGGFMDLKERRLVADPREVLKEPATDPDPLGL
ncbi:thioesterase family protein [Streptomyces sp. NPDC018347]|uniref:thioesterase family protein n=1 Tax=Streptomyces sp. NPDC018347 TaxID=3157193 RepID=UPI003406BECD